MRTFRAIRKAKETSGSIRNPETEAFLLLSDHLTSSESLVLSPNKHLTIEYIENDLEERAANQNECLSKEEEDSSRIQTNSVVSDDTKSEHKTKFSNEIKAKNSIRKELDKIETKGK